MQNEANIVYSSPGRRNGSHEDLILGIAIKIERGSIPINLCNFPSHCDVLAALLHAPEMLFTYAGTIQTCYRVFNIYFDEKARRCCGTRQLPSPFSPAVVKNARAQHILSLEKWFAALTELRQL